jgi:hypothetical protein
MQKCSLSSFLRRTQVAQRQEIAAAFLKRFTLGKDQEDALLARNLQIDVHFFNALTSAETIRHECLLLLSHGDEESRVGCVGRTTISSAQTDIRERRNYVANFAPCRACLPSIESEFQQLTGETSPDIKKSLQEAIKHLSRKPELLEY